MRCFDKPAFSMLHSFCCRKQSLKHELLSGRLTRKSVLVASILALGGWLLFVPPVAAECARADVDYYLSKGFTPEQIAALCGGASGKKKYQAEDEKTLKKARIRKAEEKIQDDVILAKTAIAGLDVKLNDEKLAYTRRICVAIGKTKEVTGRTRACPEVRFEVFFKDLKILETARKYYVVGQREIEVKGRVRRTLLNPFSEYAKPQRRELIRAYKAKLRKGGTHVPIRVDAPLWRVEDLLREYAAKASSKS